jgi:DNA-3-methyladenine glycosylase
MKTNIPIEQLPANIRLNSDFYTRDVLVVAPEMLGKTLTVLSGSNMISRSLITEVEAYRGHEDKACHASRGRTPRNEVMYHEGGKVYVYLVYGIYWMLNVVTGKENDPQAVLIRGISGAGGPGKLSMMLGIDKSFYGEDLTTSARIWIEDSGITPLVRTGKRIGIDYAGEYWKDRPWRFYM